MDIPGRQPEKHFSEHLVSTLQGIVILLNTDARIVLCNPYFENLTGYSANEVLGRDWVNIFIPEAERERIRDYFSEVMRDGLNDGYVNAIVLKNNEQRLIQWHSKTMEDSEGKIVGMLCTGYDVTEQTANLLAIKEARKAAEKANAGKSRFLAAASHDLRQPLQSLGLYLSVLTRQFDHFDSGESKDVCDKMRQSIDTMSELLDALLDISKLDSGSVTPEKQDIHLRQLLDRIIADSIQQAEEKGLELECSVEDCVLHSDPGLLQRVIENLVANAIRYTEHGRITIDCQRRDGVARIAVSDTGIGIAADKIDKVFEEYYQLDNSVRDRRKGLGLGLSIVKHISRLLDHPLNVSSVPGEGSTFAIDVPLGTQIAQIEAETQEDIPPNARDLTLLFIDDDPAIVDAISMLLKSAGIQVYTALDGDSALAHLTAGVRPDMIVSDYRLPGYDGVEVVRRVRQATVDNLPSILLTGDTCAKEIESANLANCTVLHKPVDTDRLISLIQNVTS